MSQVIRIQNGTRGSAVVPVLPEAREPIRVRRAGLGDYDFIDALQKRHSHAVGFMWEKAIKGHIEKGNVLVAEATKGPRGRGAEGPSGENSDASAFHSTPGPLDPSAPSPAAPQPVGYVLGVDRYLKRDELGIIYQMNVLPEFQRSLVAAHLLKAKFESSAYGCRLYCCWCAQDLVHANRFWEAMGFVPLAFRTGGGRGKTRKDGKFRGRMHIFWQKRIRAGDHGPGHPDTTCGGGGTAYWFPSITGAGAIGEDRIVLPIPPGTHWSDAKPIVLPEGPREGEKQREMKRLESEVQRLEREKKQAVKTRKAKRGKEVVPGAELKRVEHGGLRFGMAAPSAEEGPAKREARAETEAALKAAKKAARQAKKKFDPAQEAFARELKDRWLEQVLAEPHLIAPSLGSERYNVCRTPGSIPAPGSSSGSLEGDQHESSHVIEGTVPEARRLEAA